MDLRILLVNWRDLSHPAAGGAEVYTEEVGKRLVNFGNEVTIFTSAFDGCEHETYRSGMRIVRKGGKYSVYVEARKFVKQYLAEFDVVIDEINTVPFGVPRIVKNKPVVALIHQLAREIWFHETRFPINVLGYLVLEPLWLRQYKQVPTITVSESTRMDLEGRGFQHVRIVHNGIGTKPLAELPQKAVNPVLVFVGRLVRSKHPDHAISAFKQVRKVLPNARLWIVGDGYMRRKFERSAEDGVTFYGRLRDEVKFELLREAHVLLAPSAREGWGVSVMEANAMGTPAVGYDVRGLKDSIVDNVTGLRVRSNPDALALATIHLLQNSTMLRDLSINALAWSRRFSWDQTGAEFNNFLRAHVEGSTDYRSPSQ